jgi:pentatricopeptide repeat protein
VLEAAAAIDPTRALPFTYLADLHLALREPDGSIAPADVDASIAAARHALELDPRTPLARKFLLKALRHDGRYVEACDVAARGIGLGVNDGELWWDLFFSSMLTGTYEQLIGLARNALDATAPLGARSEVVRDMLVAGLARTGRFEEARQVLQEASRTRSEDPELQRKLADISLQSGRYEDALALLESVARAHDVDPDLDEPCLAARARLEYVRDGVLPASLAPAGIERARALHRCGAFAECARACEPLLVQGTDREALELSARASARAAEEAWNRSRRSAQIVSGAAVRGDIVAPEPADATRETSAEDWAARALACLESDLATRSVDAGARPSLRAAHEQALFGVLGERDYLVLREPPHTAPWAERARRYFWSVRGTIVHWRRDS